MSLARGKHQYLAKPLWGALFLLALCGLLLFAYVVRSAYLESWSEARFTARSQAELIEARLDATLRRLDADLSILQDELPREAMDAAHVKRFKAGVEARLERLSNVFPEIAGFRVIDAQGRLLYLGGGGDYVDISDRAYFQALVANVGDGLVFSERLASRITGRATMVAARAVRATDGRFLGVVSAAVELDYFDRLFQSARLGEAGVMGILRSDSHQLLVRQPMLVEHMNQPLPNAHPLVEKIAAGERQGELEFRSGMDGMWRVHAYRMLERYPFYVVAGLSEEDVMAGWRQRIYLAGGLGVICFASLIGLLAGLFRLQGKAAEASSVLERRDYQLREAQRLAQVGSWVLDHRDNRLEASDQLYEIFELSPALTAGSYEQFLTRIYPDDRAQVDRAYYNSVSQHVPYQIEYRLLMSDGRVKFVRECGESSYDADGRPLRSIGTAQDITGLRHLESQTSLLGSAFQYSGEAILITDSENRIITVNPAFSRLTGYSAEEALGRNPKFLSAGRNSREDYERMWREIAEQGFWQGEIWDRRKDGHVYPKWMSVSVIRNDDGSIRYHLAHFTDVSAERAAEAQLQHYAHHDTLTGLLNRLSLSGRLDQALAAARRDGGRVALLFIDLDRFKVINDTVGHHIGDKLLIEVARRLCENVRDSDVVARLGGDEFVIMLTGLEHSGAAAVVAAKLVASVSDPYLIEGYDLYTTPSIGIAIFPTDGGDGETLMKNADAAMYHAKAEGRNNFQFFDSRMNDAAVERLKTEHSLRQALAHDEFCLHFQPLLDLSTGRVMGVEALVRWHHPEKGLIMPGHFIGIAEESGLIQPLGEWVFWSACRQLADFRAAGLHDIKMGVNISAMQMRNGNLPILAKGAIEAFGLDPTKLIFEITESVAMQQPDETVRILDILHDMGICLAIDDFGTGYSSLSYLRMFPIDHLKLDRSFVREIGESADSAAICDATIGLAHSLGMRLVAEGVETESELAYLRARGCDFVQGYLFSRPVPADEVMAFVRERNG